MTNKKRSLLFMLTLILSATSLKSMHKPQQEVSFFDGIRANSIELVRQLALAYPSLVPAYDCYGNTPLHLAVTYKRTEIVRFVCEHYSRAVLLKNRRSETPLHIAAQLGYREAIALLIQSGAPVDVADGDGNTPLHKAACSGATEGIDLLHAALSCTNHIRYSPLHIAVQYGHQATLQKLLEYASQGDIERVTSDNESPLMMAIIYGHLPCVYLLLDHGASTDPPDGKPSLLKQALTHRQIHIARHLLEHGIAIETDTTSILDIRRFSPDQTYHQFLEEVHEQRVNALKSCNQVPDDLCNLIATFVLSQIIRDNNNSQPVPAVRPPSIITP